MWPGISLSFAEQIVVLEISSIILVVATKEIAGPGFIRVSNVGGGGGGGGGQRRQL